MFIYKAQVICYDFFATIKNSRKVRASLSDYGGRMETCMKKIISMALIVAIAFTMIIVPTVSSAAVTATLAMKNVNGEFVSLYGKTANEKVTQATGSGKELVRVTTTSTTDFDFTDKKYAVLDLNVAPVATVTDFAVGPNAGGYYAVKSNEFVAGRWNSVRIVMEEKSKADIAADSTSQKYTMYINGTKVGEGTSKSDQWAKMEDICGGFRFAMTGTFGGSYIGDARISDSDVNEAPVMPALEASSKYVISNDTVVLNPVSVTLGDLKSTGNTVRLLKSDNTLKTDASDVVEAGDTVVVIDADKHFTYYAVSSARTVIVDGYNATSALTATEYTSAIAGKDASVTKLVNDKTSNNGYFQVNSGSVYPDTRTGKYFVLEMNYLPTCNETYLNFLGQGSVSLGLPKLTVSGGAIKKDRWNKIVVVIENGATAENPRPQNTTYNSRAEALAASPHKISVYYNGTLHTDGTTTKFPTQYAMTWTDGTSTKWETSIRVETTKASTSETYTSYIDDVIMYHIDDLSLVNLGTPELESFGDAVISGKEINLKSDISVADANAMDGITVISKTEGNLAVGDVVAYTDGKDVSYYTVALPKDKVYTEYSAYNNKYASVNNGRTEAANGITGEADGAFKVYSTDRTDDTPQNNAYFNLGTYDREYFGERTYSIFSVDFKFEDDAKQIYFGSNGNYPISGYVTYKDIRVVDGWNNIVCVVDYETNQSITYVNGMPSAVRTSNVGKEFYNGVSGQIRLIIDDRGKDGYNTEATEVAVATVDNIKVYATVTNPFATPLEYTETAENVTFTACDYIKNGYDYVVIAAAYDAHDNLIGTVSVGTDTATIAKNADADHYVGYIWNSFTGLVPVAAAVAVEG